MAGKLQELEEINKELLIDKQRLLDEIAQLKVLTRTEFLPLSALQPRDRFTDVNSQVVFEVISHWENGTLYRVYPKVNGGYEFLYPSDRIVKKLP